MPTEATPVEAVRPVEPEAVIPVETVETPPPPAEVEPPEQVVEAKPMVPPPRRKPKPPEPAIVETPPEPAPPETVVAEEPPSEQTAATPSVAEAGGKAGRRDSTEAGISDSGTIKAFLEDYPDLRDLGLIAAAPGVQALIADALEGRFEIVLAEAMDRLSRNQEDITGFYKRMAYADVQIVTLSEGEVLHLHVGLKGTMNALFLKDLADKTWPTRLGAVCVAGWRWVSPAGERLRL